MIAAEQSTKKASSVHLNRTIARHMSCLCALLFACHCRLSASDYCEYEIGRLQSAEAKDRVEAAFALGEIGDERAVRPLLTCLGDSAPQMQVTVMEALGRLRAPGALEPIMQRAIDPKSTPSARRSAVKALGYLGDPRAVEALLTALTREPREKDLRVAVTGALMSFGPVAVAPLILALESTNSSRLADVKPLVANLLGDLGDQKAVDPLIACLADSNPVELRVSAARALGKLHDKRAVEPLIKSLCGKDVWDLVVPASEALGQLRDSRAAEVLLGTLRRAATGDSYLAVATALGLLGESRAYKPLLRELQSKHDHLDRGAAARALGLLGDRRCYKALLACFEDRNEPPEVRKPAAEGLAHLGDARAREPLFRCAKNTADNVQVRMGAALGVAQLGDPRAALLLLDLLGENQFLYWQQARKWAFAAWKRIGGPAVDVLIPCLEGQNKEVYCLAVTALGEIGDARAIEPLRRHLTSFSYTARQLTWQAIVKLGYQPITESDKVAYVSGTYSWIRSWHELAANRDLKPLSILLARWDIQHQIASALHEAGWSPSADSEWVHWFIARRDRWRLLSDYGRTQNVLLTDLRSGHPQVTRTAIYTFIGLGQTHMIPELCALLDTKEDAETFLNCGNEELAQAAKAWAARNGYDIRSGVSGRPSTATGGGGRYVNVAT